MNSDPNSDSEQCPESKLGQVHRVHTQRTLATRNAPRPRTRRALGSVSWPHFSVSQVVSCVSPHARTRWCAVSQSLGLPCCNPTIATQNLCHDTTLAMRAVSLTLLRVSQRSCAVSHGAVTLYSSRVAGCVATQGRPSTTIQNFYPYSPPAIKPCACTLSLGPRVGLPCCRASWLCRGRVMVVSCLPMCAPVRLCYNTTCCIVTQTQKMGSSPSSLPCPFFFLLIIFFPFVFSCLQ